MKSSEDIVFASAGELTPPSAALVVRIPGQIDKANLLRLLARELQFPDYFRSNWDALEECLRDLSWLPAQRPIVLLHTGLPLARRADQRAVYIDILRTAMDAQRARQGPTLQVIFPRNCRTALCTGADASHQL